MENMENIIYFDHSATTAVDKEVLNEMLPCFTNKYGNPSSMYTLGSESKSAINKARKQIASVINAKNSEIYFTSGGSEADNLIIKGIAMANKNRGNHIITSKIEHMAVLNTCKYLEKNGFEVTYLDCDKDGFIIIDELRKAITDKTILVSIMFANNEIGTIQKIKEIGEITHFKQVIFHTDAVQAIGSVKIDVEEMKIDCLSMSAHKFYGPKGVGAAYIKNDIAFDAQILGGHQEHNKRAGTENVPAIVGMGKAISIANDNMLINNATIEQLRDFTLNEILTQIAGSKLNGSITNRLPGNINISIEGVDAKALLISLNLKNIAASIGSACNSTSSTPSHVLQAIGLTTLEALSSIRFTLGKENTLKDCNYLVNSLKEIVNEIRIKKNPAKIN